MRLSNSCAPVEVKFSVPNQSTSQPRIKEISCGSKHSLMLTVEGGVYACGNGERG